MTQVITKAAFARELEVSRQMVNKWLAAGLPQRKDGKLDRGAAQRWLHEFTQRDRRGAGQLAAARLRHLSAIARLKELEVARVEGSMVDSAATENYVSSMIIECRNRLLRIPTDLCDRLAQESDPVQCHEMLDDTLRHALTALSEWRPTPSPELQ